LIMVAGFFLLLWAGHVYVALFVVFLQVVLFKELTSVRYDFVKAKDVPLFRTLQWAWFTISMFYTYGQQIIEFAHQNNLLRHMKEVGLGEERRGRG
jgi:phosphatidate cytidylyltransferase